MFGQKILKIFACLSTILLVVLLSSVLVYAGKDDEKGTGLQSSGAKPNTAVTEAASTVEGDSAENTGSEEELNPFELELKKLVESTELEETEEFLIKFLNPSKKEIKISKNTFNIVGVQVNNEKKFNQNVIVVLCRYNEETGSYEEFKNDAGESRWEKSLMCTLSVKLQKGLHKFKILVYVKPQEEENGNIKEVKENARLDEDIKIDLEPGKDVQVTYFVVNVLINDETKEKLVNDKADINDVSKFIPQVQNSGN